MAEQKKEKKTILAKVAAHIVTQEYDEWPPKCATFLYQPKRPTVLKRKEETGPQETVVH